MLSVATNQCKSKYMVYEKIEAAKWFDDHVQLTRSTDMSATVFKCINQQYPKESYLLIPLSDVIFQTSSVLIHRYRSKQKQCIFLLPCIQRPGSFSLNKKKLRFLEETDVIPSDAYMTSFGKGGQFATVWI